MAKDPDINPTLLIYYCDLTSKAGTAIHYYRSHTMDLNNHQFTQFLRANSRFQTDIL